MEQESSPAQPGERMCTLGGMRRQLGWALCGKTLASCIWQAGPEWGFCWGRCKNQGGAGRWRGAPESFFSCPETELPCVPHRRHSSVRSCAIGTSCGTPRAPELQFSQQSAGG